MSELSPWPTQAGYTHRDALARQQYEATIADLTLPMRRADYIDQCDRDVAAAGDEPVVMVWTDRKQDTVTIRADAKTAAVLLYAAELMATSEEARARDAMRAADLFPADSYGRQNRVEQAIRRERVAKRLRVVKTAYRDVVHKIYWGE